MLIDTLGIPFSAWSSISALGDLATIVPLAAVIATHLVQSAVGRSISPCWILTLLAVSSVVAISKLIFMLCQCQEEWPHFSGVSGHSALAATVWPFLSVLLCRPDRRWRRVMGTTLGILLTALVAVSRVALHAHSISEVVAGVAVGSTACIYLLCRMRGHWRSPSTGVTVALTVLIVLPLTYGYRFPSQQALAFAVKLLGAA